MCSSGTPAHGSTLRYEVLKCRSETAHGGCFPIQRRMHGLAYILVHGVTRADMVLGMSFRVAVRILGHSEGDPIPGTRSVSDSEDLGDKQAYR